ncbi:hypothetical protein [Frankia sp. AgKG'84/4]|uniref:hypothetical protein n=1 Tax=Frankia sp. AgKG'84/4 TaxID=573490 RepID=UPI00200E7560|nr:hypothetical protein [Frankia sp. AgKG'84/4]MCL9793837.1 hypothetical protein [Frankia sp. AgKG'84/4]
MTTPSYPRDPRARRSGAGRAPVTRHRCARPLDTTKRRPRPSPGAQNRLTAALGVLAAVLIAAFVLAPGPLANLGTPGDLADHGRLLDALRAGFTGYWHSGERSPSGDLVTVIDFWCRYHLAKGAIAALLLAVFVALTVRLWHGFLRAGQASVRAALASAGAATTAFALVPLAAVMANLQGAAAPFASLFPMLTEDGGDQPFAAALMQARRQLADPTGAGAGTSPAIDAMTDEFARYHVVMAVISSVLAVVAVGVAVLLWRRFAATASTDRRTRRVLGSGGALTVLLAVLLVIHVAANVSVAADPAPALARALNGGL